MIYGYRRPPYGVRGCVSEDGVTWDARNEFMIREGGVPGRSESERPGSSRMSPASGKYGGGRIDWSNPGVYQHIGYPSVVQLSDGTVVASLSRMGRCRAAAAICAHDALPPVALRHRLRPWPTGNQASTRTNTAT